MTSPALVKALVAAQADFGGIGKTQENKHFGSKYADLASVLNAVRPVLTKHGLALVQVVSENEAGTTLVTKLLHETGELESVMPLAIDGLNSQQVGSVLTYQRRYSALAICGVHPEDDDDDGTAASTAAPAARTAPRGQSGGKAASPKQVAFAEKLLGDVVAPPLTLDYIAETVGRTASLDELYTHEMSKLIDRLQDDKKAGRTPEGVVAEYGPGEEPF
jgi:hypothetical protein